MEAKLDLCFQVNKSFFYDCEYKFLLKKLSEKALPFEFDSKYYFINSFLKQMFSASETSLSKSFVKYSTLENKKRDVLKKCKKSNFSVFHIECIDFMKNEFSPTKIYGTIKNQTKEIIEKLRSKKFFDYFYWSYRKSNYVIKDVGANDKPLEKEEFKEWLNSVLSNSYTYDDNIRAFFYVKNIVHNTIKKYSKTFLFEYLKELKSGDPLASDDYHTINNIKDEICKRVHKVDDLLDVVRLLNNYVISFVITASKFGAINVSAIAQAKKENEKDKDISEIAISNDDIKPLEQKGKIISGIMNSFSKIFSFLDLNLFLGFHKQKYIFMDVYNQSLKRVDNYKNKKVVNKFPVHKSIFLSIIPDCNDAESIKIAGKSYNYLSLLIAFQHTYRSELIREFFHGKPELDYMKYKIIDVLKKEDEHLYFDDNLSLISTIDLNNDSHRASIYSFWDFMYVCDSLIFSSVSKAITSIFNSYALNKSSGCCSGFRPIANKTQIRLSSIASQIESILDYRCYSAKIDSIDIANFIFKSTGLIDMQENVRKTFEMRWENANLINNQKYSRLSLIFSASALLMTIISVGFISTVFLSDHTTCNNLCSILFHNENGVFNSVKFWLFTAIFLIAIGTWFTINLVEAFVAQRLNITKMYKLRKKINKMLAKHE
ncbi:MAG: hypothetical protein LBM03_00735 [Erysipelotrichaceae bacterium]|jgi:hypothetical protein|nr:hypothetical protein [Erysipelotrichaceae bacterium]